jgi:hypothetical protein
VSVSQALGQPLWDDVASLAPLPASTQFRGCSPTAQDDTEADLAVANTLSDSPVPLGSVSALTQASQPGCPEVLWKSDQQSRTMSDPTFSFSNTIYSIIGSTQVTLLVTSPTGTQLIPQASILLKSTTRSATYLLPSVKLRHFVGWMVPGKYQVLFHDRTTRSSCAAIQMIVVADTSRQTVVVSCKSVG